MTRAAPARRSATKVSISPVRRRACLTKTVTVSGLPWVNLSSGRQSGTRANLSAPPGWAAATAWASSRRSSIGIGGMFTRRCRLPSQARSSRREVSRTRHRVEPAISRRN